MTDLTEAARRAAATADADTTANPASRKIRAIKHLRKATGLGIRECLPAVDAALAGQPVTLTRAAKEAAVTEMTRRVAVRSENWTDENHTPRTERYRRDLDRAQRALVRIAMARTVD
jgi:hypothetical protein